MAGHFHGSEIVTRIRQRWAAQSGQSVDYPFGYMGAGEGGTEVDPSDRAAVDRGLLRSFHSEARVWSPALFDSYEAWENHVIDVLIYG